MRKVPPQLIGINVNEVSRICHVSLKTAGRWKSGTTCPPLAALMLLAGDIGAFDPAWRGWRAHRGKLISPEGWEITVNDMLAHPLMRQQLAAYQRELRRLKERLELTQEQPLPAAWPEWVFEKFA